jgi:DNA-binding CsgD family transcriptional regulator
VAELAVWQGRPGRAVDRIREALTTCDLGAPHRLMLSVFGLWAEAERAQTMVADAKRGHADAAELFLAGADKAATAAARITPDAEAWLARARAEYSRLDGPADPEAWRTAAAAWEELSRPYHMAYCRWRLADALLALGSPIGRAEARKALRQAYRTAAALRATPLRHQIELAGQRARIDVDEPLPPPTPESARGLGLTSREAEVLALLARGYTNRDIAGELTISVKTASVHVSHILAKLGVHRRIEAAAIGQRLLPMPRRPT